VSSSWFRQPRGIPGSRYQPGLSSIATGDKWADHADA
jgi:hypothetical protein